MNGAQVNTYLERGLFGKYAIHKLLATPGFNSLERPSDLLYTTGVADSVCQQAHQIDAVWNGAQKSLTLSQSATGEGYWIPYIGNGAHNAPVGVAVTLLRGLGTYTPTVTLGGNISWVATGPFSGCSSASFTALNGDMVFAHLSTPPAGYTADTLPNQVANIAAQTGFPAPAAAGIQQVLSGRGLGYVFWTYIGAAWYRRVVWANFGKVVGVERRNQI